MNVIEDRLIDFRAYMDAPAESPHVRSPSVWLDRVLDRIRYGYRAQGAYLPWGSLAERVRIRTGEVSLWAGINGHGKSIMLSQVILGLMAQGQKACIASMEMLPEATMYRMTRQALGSKNPTEDFIRDFHGWADQYLYLYDQQGKVSADRILALGRYTHAELGVQHLVVDSLMKCGIGVDDYNRQKDFIDQLCSHAMDTGQHIHLVVHARKGAHGEERPIGKFDIKGASEITDQVHNVFLVWRNKPKEVKVAADANSDTQDEPDTLLSTEKQREGEWEGRTKLWFAQKSMQFIARDLAPLDYVEMSERMDRWARESAQGMQG